MRKIFIVLAIMSMAISLYAKDYGVAPMNQKGDEIGINYIGAKSVVKSAIVAETLGFAGEGIIYGVVVSSGVTTQYVMLSDSSTACAGNGVQITPKIFFEGTASAVKTFPKPIKVTYGVTYKCGAATGGQVQLIYRLKSDN